MTNPHCIFCDKTVNSGENAMEIRTQVFQSERIQGDYHFVCQDCYEQRKLTSDYGTPLSLGDIFGIY